MGAIANWLSAGVFYGTVGSVAFTVILLAVLVVAIYLTNPYYTYVRWALKSFANLSLRRLAV